jgi:hypothetical protein
MAPALRALLVALALGQADVPQALTSTDIMQAIGDHKADLARCNEEYAGSSVHDLVLHFRILPDGHTAGVKSRGGRDNRPLVTCVERLMRHMQFGQYGGPAMPPVDFPVSFGPVPPRPRSRAGSPRPTKRDVVQAVHAQKAAFAACVRDHPGGGGTTVIFHWTIELDGSLSDVHRNGGDVYEDPALVDCLEQHVRSLHFRPYQAQKPVQIDFPFQR